MINWQYMEKIAEEKSFQDNFGVKFTVAITSGFDKTKTQGVAELRMTILHEILLHVLDQYVQIHHAINAFASGSLDHKGFSDEIHKITFTDGHDDHMVYLMPNDIIHHILKDAAKRLDKKYGTKENPTPHMDDFNNDRGKYLSFLPKPVIEKAKKKRRKNGKRR